MQMTALCCLQRWDLHVVEAKDFKTKALEEDYDNFK